MQPKESAETVQLLASFPPINEGLVQEPGPGQQATGKVRARPDAHLPAPRAGEGRTTSRCKWTRPRPTSSPQMLYQNDLHPTPTLHLTSRNWIDIAVPEDIGHALVQIRTTGPGGDGIPAEVHIVRNGGAVSPPPYPPGASGSIRMLPGGAIPTQTNPN